MQRCRVLLDPGSKSNLITEELVNLRKLKLKGKDKYELISGINKSRMNATRNVKVKIKSMHDNYETTIECLVLPSITEKMPQVNINASAIYLPKAAVGRSAVPWTEY